MSAKALPEPEPDDAPQRELTSEELFAGKPEVLIQHRGASYRLRITRQDKLILTK